MAKYPSQDKIKEMFASLAEGKGDAFFEHVQDNVNWTVMGTHPLGGVYNSKQKFAKETLGRLGAIMKPPGLSLQVRNVIGGGESPWAVVELVAKAVCKNDLAFDNTYAWVLHFDEQGKIALVRAYLDSQLVKQAIEENECPSHRAPVNADVL